MRHSQLLRSLRLDAKREWGDILSYWKGHTVDHMNGGFVGQIKYGDVVVPNASKGAVLNARILWSFSAASRHSNDRSYLELATRAYEYLAEHFVDKAYGGVYWTVTADGHPHEIKKQVYASAFALYGVAEYCRASGNGEARNLAIDLYTTLIARAFDMNNGGFFEAYTYDWRALNDQRLSVKDANEKKSASTHLHVLEAFANLYLVWPDDGLRQHIVNLLNLFSDKIINSEGTHLMLFFDEQWKHKPGVVSYGHDIEAAWLLQQCAEIIADSQLMEIFKRKAITLALGAMEGASPDGSLWYEYDLNEHRLIREKHWWPQAEAVVGYLNAWQISKEQQFLDAATNCWHFIMQKMRDPSGEWHWGVLDDGSVMTGEDKVGLWKCPYHNSRACMEIIQRADALLT